MKGKVVLIPKEKKKNLNNTDFSSLINSRDVQIKNKDIKTKNFKLYIHIQNALIS